MTRTYNKSLQRRVFEHVNRMDAVLKRDDMEYVKKVYKEWRKDVADVIDMYENKKKVREDRRMGKNIPKEWWGGE